MAPDTTPRMHPLAPVGARSLGAVEDSIGLGGPDFLGQVPQIGAVQPHHLVVAGVTTQHRPECFPSNLRVGLARRRVFPDVCGNAVQLIKGPGPTACSRTPGVDQGFVDVEEDSEGSCHIRSSGRGVVSGVRSLLQKTTRTSVGRFEGIRWEERSMAASWGQRHDKRATWTRTGLTVCTAVTTVVGGAAFAAGAAPVSACRRRRPMPSPVGRPVAVYLPVDDAGIPTGRRPVDGTPYDLRESEPVPGAGRQEQVPSAGQRSRR